MSFIFTTNSNSSPRKEKVADWAGSKKRNAKLKSQQQQRQQQQQPEEANQWKDVHSNIKQMDQIYDATFYAWLKSEENVLVTSIYLHRIANEYPLERIINALEWLTSDWRWESTSILIRHMTVDWCDDDGDFKRAELLRKLTNQWATHYTATMISTILMSSPYINCSTNKRETFLREFTKEWDFSRLSEFFMFLRSRTNIDYKFKCMMLQEAARRDVLVNSSAIKQDTTVHTPAVTTPSNAAPSTTQHHRRTSSNDFQDIKRNILEEDEVDEEPFNICYPSSSSAATASVTSSSASTTTSRYHHHARLSTSSSTITMTTASSSSSNNNDSVGTGSSSDNLIPSPSTSTSNLNNDKRKITVI